MNKDRDVGRESTDEDYKWATQDMDKNKDIVLALGGCWHELIPYDKDGYKCSCGFETYYGGLYGDHERGNPNPDFTSDAGKVQLLREMAEQPELYYDFLGKLTSKWHGVNSLILDKFINEYLLDPLQLNPSKLRDAAWGWLNNRKEKP